MNPKVNFSISLLLPIVALIKSFDYIDWRISLAYCLLISLLTFGANFLDKRRAKQAGQRVPEKVLHLLEFIGGWPAAFLAQQKFRHKTVKRSYRIVFWLIVLCYQVLALDYLLNWRFLNWLTGA